MWLNVPTLNFLKFFKANVYTFEVFLILISILVLPSSFNKFCKSSKFD